VESVRKFLRARTKSAKENIEAVKEVVKSDEFRKITSNLKKNPSRDPEYSHQHQDQDRKKHSNGTIKKLNKTKEETFRLIEEKKAVRSARNRDGNAHE
jgi:hypothetical protein